MAQRYNFEQSDSSKLTENGEFETDLMSSANGECVAVIAAYDASGDIVTPSAGIATISCSPINGQWHNGSSTGGNPIDLTRIGADSSYEMPTFSGPMILAKINISGVDFATDGIDHFKAFMWRE